MSEYINLMKFVFCNPEYIGNLNEGLMNEGLLKEELMKEDNYFAQYVRLELRQTQDKINNPPTINKNKINEVGIGYPLS